MKYDMIINEPVVHLVFAGNVRDRLAQNKFVAFASYEGGETHCFIKVVGHSRALAKAIKKDFSKYGKIKSVTYRPNGLEIIRIEPN